MDLALNNLQKLICHNNQPTNHYKFILPVDQLVFQMDLCFCPNPSEEPGDILVKWIHNEVNLLIFLV